MNKTAISKTLLTALSKYEQFLAAIDTSILNQAQRSYQNYSTTMQTIEEIINNMQKKTLLHNLRVKTEKLLEIAPQKFSRILILHYMHGLTTKKIAGIINKTERTVFRYLSSGLEWFSARINNFFDGYDLACVLDEEKWLRNIYNRLLLEN